MEHRGGLKWSEVERSGPKWTAKVVSLWTGTVDGINDYLRGPIGFIGFLASLFRVFILILSSFLFLGCVMCIF